MTSRTLTALALSILASTAVAQESPLTTCRKIAMATERLACYDAIPATAVAAAKAAVKEEPKLIETAIAGRFAGWWPNDKLKFTNGQTWQIIDGSTGAMDLVDPKVRIEREYVGGYHLVIEGTNRTPRVRQVLSAEEQAAVFAAEKEQAKAPDDALIESSIAGRFTGWWPKERIKLTNDQVWQVIDGSTGAIDVTDPKVRIRREYVGGYRLEIEGAAPAPRVQRVQ